MKYRKGYDNPLRHLILLVLVILPLYVMNGRWGIEGNADAIAVGLAAHQVVNHQTLDLSIYPTITENLDQLDRWYVENQRGQIVSNRAPGLIAIAIPAYTLIRQPGYSNGPATAVALMTTFLSVLVSWHVLQGIVSLKTATTAALVLALGTTTWWVSSSELWPHGPGQLWAAIGVLLLGGGSLVSTGLMFGLSVITRPVTAVYGLTTSALEAVRTRHIAPLVTIGFGTSLGVLALLAYNRLVFGIWSLRGGYSERFTSGALDRFTIPGYISNVWEMFLGLPNGVLVTTPIIGLAVIGAFLAREQIPGWAKSVAWAAVAYLLIHSALNRASGGSAVFYRYPLEPLVLALPALVIGARHLWDRNVVLKGLVAVAIALSIAGQLLHVLLFSCWITEPVVRMCVLN